MRFFIRADASEMIGTGHVMRCLTLADELLKDWHEVIFIIRQMPEYFVNLMKKKGISLIRLDSNHSVGSIEDANSIVEILQSNFVITLEDCLIIDHYDIDHKWEFVLKQTIYKIVVIDDLANRKHMCTILLDTNLYDTPEQRYTGLVSTQTRKLLGPQYALLREEFSEVRNHMVKSEICSREPTNILICFGGTDPTNETTKVINALELLLNCSTKFELTVIVGRTNPNIQSIQEKCNNSKNIRFLIQPPSMALEMSRSHIAVCGGGTMTWERYCMGLPALVIAIADNQIGIAQQGEKRNIDRYLGESQFVSVQRIQKELITYLDYPQLVEIKRQMAMALVDGEGAKRVSRIITDKIR